MLTVKFFPVDEAAERYSGLFDVEENGFYVVHEQEWVDYLPDHVCIVLDTDTQVVLYSLPAREQDYERYKNASSSLHTSQH